MADERAENIRPQRPIVDPRRLSAAAVSQGEIAGGQRKADIPQLTEQDVRPESLAFKINQVLQVLASQVAQVQGRSGPFRFEVGPLVFSGRVTFEGSAEFEQSVEMAGHSDATGNPIPVRYTLGLPVYANNDAAKAGGLLAGHLYRTAEGVVRIVY